MATPNKSAVSPSGAVTDIRQLFDPEIEVSPAMVELFKREMDAFKAMGDEVDLDAMQRARLGFYEKAQRSAKA